VSGRTATTLLQAQLPPYSCFNGCVVLEAIAPCCLHCCCLQEPQNEQSSLGDVLVTLTAGGASRSSAVAGSIKGGASTAHAAFLPLPPNVLQVSARLSACIVLIRGRHVPAYLVQVGGGSCCFRKAASAPSHQHLRLSAHCATACTATRCYAFRVSLCVRVLYCNHLGWLLPCLLSAAGVGLPACWQQSPQQQQHQYAQKPGDTIH
jgi:hypothetical protein